MDTFTATAFLMLDARLQERMRAFGRNAIALHTDANTGEINLTALAEDISDQFELWEGDEFTPSEACFELALLLADQAGKRA